MKVKKKDGKIVEVDKDYKLQAGEEEEKEPGEEEEKAVKFLGEKIEGLIKAITETPQRKILGKDADLEKSVIEIDPFLRKIRPFVQLSKKMEDFITDVKMMARGGVPLSLQKALNEGVDTEGGFLVPEEFNAEVIRFATETAIVRPRATIRPMGRDIATWPVLDQSGDKFAGIELHWLEEGALKVESQPKFGKLTLKVKDLIGLIPVSDSLLADSAINLANFLVALFGEAIAYEEDKQFLTGNGMGKPLGIIEGGCNDVKRVTANKIKYIDLKKMMTALPAWADAGAIWITTKAGLEELLNIKSGVYNGTAIDETEGFPLLLPGFSLGAGVPPSMLGYPIVLTDKLPVVGTKGDILLANLKFYWIGDRGALAVASSIHDRFRYNETVFRFVKRVDGQPAICKAFVVLDVPV